MHLNYYSHPIGLLLAQINPQSNKEHACLKTYEVWQTTAFYWPLPSHGLGHTNQINNEDKVL